jgi:hypothetical protein
MATITEVEKLALDLSEDKRAILAAHLLDSLSPVLHDDDDGLAEALLRDAEFDSGEAVSLSLEQMDECVARRRS